MQEAVLSMATPGVRAVIVVLPWHQPHLGAGSPPHLNSVVFFCLDFKEYIALGLKHVSKTSGFF